MKIFFDHIAGQTQKRELIYSPATAIFEKSEYSWAIENGWQIAVAWSDQSFDWYNEQRKLGIDVWYQSRVSRINLEKFREKSRHRKQIRRSGVSSVLVEHPKKRIYWKIYQQYIKHKSYSDMYGSQEVFFKPIYGERKYIEYSKSGKIIGFSILEILGETSVAVQFCWDYLEPDIKLGYVNKYFQFRRLKALGCKSMHLGASYEVGSLKKSEYSGFEWWTGRKWSENLELYTKLAKRESEMSTMDQLHKQQQMFYLEVDT